MAVWDIPCDGRKLGQWLDIHGRIPTRLGRVRVPDQADGTPVT